MGHGGLLRKVLRVEGMPERRGVLLFFACALRRSGEGQMGVELQDRLGVRSILWE